MQFCADVPNSIILQPSPLKMKVIATWGKVGRGLSLADALCLSPCKTICIVFSQENESHQQIHPPRKEILAISQCSSRPPGGLTLSICPHIPSPKPSQLQGVLSLGNSILSILLHFQCSLASCKDQDFKQLFHKPASLSVFTFIQTSNCIRIINGWGREGEGGDNLSNQFGSLLPLGRVDTAQLLPAPPRQAYLLQAELH